MTVLAINDYGLIAGTASYTPTSTNDTNAPGEHAVLLVPLPELVVETTNGSGVYQPIYAAPVYVPDNGLSQTVVDTTPPDNYAVQMTSNLSNSTAGVLSVTFTNIYGTYTGTLTETGPATGVFKSSDGTVTGTLSAGTQTTDAQVDTLSFIVTAPTIQLSNAPITVVETAPASYTFNQPEVGLTITLSGNLNPNAPDQITVAVRNYDSLVLTETGNNTQVFTDPVSGLTVAFSNLGTLNPNAPDNLQVALSGIGFPSPVTYVLQETANNSLIFTSNTPQTMVPGTPDDPTQTHHGVFYVRMKSTGITPPPPLTITVPGGGDPVTLQMSPVPNDPSYVISPPILLSQANAPTYSYNWLDKYWNVASSDPTDFKDFGAALRADNGTKKLLSTSDIVIISVAPNVGPEALIIIKGGQGLLKGLKAYWAIAPPPFLGIAMWGDTLIPGSDYSDFALSGHLDALDNTLTGYGYAPSPEDEHVTIAALKQALPNYSVFYIFAHGQIQNGHPTITSTTPNFEGFRVWDDALAWWNPAHLVTASDISGANGTHPYNLVFINGCASADNSLNTVSDYIDAFHAKNYIGWLLPVQGNGAAAAAKHFFTHLKGGETVSQAINASDVWTACSSGYGNSPTKLTAGGTLDNNVILDLKAPRPPPPAATTPSE